MNTEHDIVTIEQHRIWIEEPYLMVLEVIGDINESAMHRMRDMLQVVGGGRGPIILVQDLSKAGIFTFSARKAMAEDKRLDRIATIICMGAGFQWQVLLGIMTKASRVVFPNLPAVKLAKDETECRACVAAERERLQREYSDVNP